MVSFGVGYALASLSCTFGVLLAVIAQAQATADYAGIALVFGVYAAGSATVLLLLALVTAVAGTALTRHVAALARYGPRVTAVILLVTGGYLAWYWYPAATGAAPATSGWLVGLSAAASSWVQGHTTLLAALVLLAVVAVIALAVRQHKRARTPTPPKPTPADPKPADPKPADPTSSPPIPPDDRNDSGPHCC